MFGYVTPCKMELKIKDYERFKAYYCGLCKAIKSSFGNIPRMVLNYDMTFLAVLLDSLSSSPNVYSKERCMVHPVKKRIVIIQNSALHYAAFCNTALVYYKLLDNVKDDRSLSSKAYSLILHSYLNKFSAFPALQQKIEEKLSELYQFEKDAETKSLDELANPFAELTGLLLCTYIDTLKNEASAPLKDTLYWLGYNLGKWIYLIDAWDDLEKDIPLGKFNAIHSVLNTNNLSLENFITLTKDRIDFTLTACAQQCMYFLDQLPLKKNEDILYNILQFGLMEKMDNVFKRSECENEKSL